MPPTTTGKLDLEGPSTSRIFVATFAIALVVVALTIGAVWMLYGWMSTLLR